LEFKNGASGQQDIQPVRETLGWKNPNPLISLSDPLREFHQGSPFRTHWNSRAAPAPRHRIPKPQRRNPMLPRRWQHVPVRAAAAASQRRKGRLRVASSWRRYEGRAEKDQQFRRLSGHEWSEAEARQRREEVRGVEGRRRGEKTREGGGGVSQEANEEG